MFHAQSAFTEVRHALAEDRSPSNVLDELPPAWLLVTALIVLFLNIVAAFAVAAVYLLDLILS